MYRHTNSNSMASTVRSVDALRFQRSKEKERDALEDALNINTNVIFLFFIYILFAKETSLQQVKQEVDIFQNTNKRKKNLAILFHFITFQMWWAKKSYCFFLSPPPFFGKMHVKIGCRSVFLLFSRSRLVTLGTGSHLLCCGCSGSAAASQSAVSNGGN